MNNYQNNPDPTQSEREFLASYDASRFPRPSVAVDLVLMTVENDSLRVVLIQRHEHPARDYWSLPGGFVAFDESLDDAAKRILREKARLADIFVEQLFTFGEPKRDPRTRVITVAYFALVPAKLLRPIVTNAGATTLTLASVHTQWEGEQGGPADAHDDAGAALPLAFDHAEILGMAVKRLRGRLRYSPVAFELLPEEFSLRMIQGVHEAVLSRRLNKDAFRRRVLASGELKATGRLESDVDHRPAELYRYSPMKNESVTEK